MLNKKSFINTAKVGKYLYMDGINNKLKIPRKKFIDKIIKSQIYDFSELIDFDIISEEGISLRRKAYKYCITLEVKVMLESCNRYIKIIEKPIKKTSKAYKKAFEDVQEIISTLNFVKKVARVSK